MIARRQRSRCASKLASDLSSDAKKPEPVGSVPLTEIYSWASQLASESRKLNWVFYWYMWPDSVREIFHKLETMNGGIIGLVGLQGSARAAHYSQYGQGGCFSRTKNTAGHTRPGSVLSLEETSSVSSGADNRSFFQAS